MTHYSKIDKQGLYKMVNWQIIGQLLATGIIMLSGPVVIVLLALKKGNL